jgi:cytochrome c oxidase subunit 5b
LEQATGIERYQLLGNMAGIDVFSMTPPEVTHMGTMDNPMKINSVVSPSSSSLSVLG